jgi:transcription elongation factor Elf1
MENIVQLEDYRKRKEETRTAARGSPVPRLGAQFFCTRCDADEFKLSALGMVHCAQCGSLMRNLLVSLSPSQEAG